MTGTAYSTDGIPLRYEIRGSGAPTLVFVHGWSCDRLYWTHQIEDFAHRHQVVALDLAGHGESGLGRARWTMPAFGDDVVAVANYLELDGIVLIGHSMGGDVIVEAALRLGKRVMGLVWVDVYRSLGDAESQAEHERFVAPFRSDFVTTTRNFVRRMFPPNAESDLVEWVVSDMSSAPTAVAIDALDHAHSFQPSLCRALDKLQSPVVAINPDDRPSDAQSLRAHGVELVVMPGVGHFPMMEDPDAFNRLLAETIRKFRV